MKKCKKECKCGVNDPYEYNLDLMESLTATFTNNPTSKQVAQIRKETPIFSGVLKYFPNAIKEVARVSKKGNDQHHPDKPLHWDMSKSKDELDALSRHLLDHLNDPEDEDGELHLAKVAWRSLAALERFLAGEDI